MTKEEFKKIISEIIGTSDEDALNTFIEEVGASIKGKEALRLDGIGYFQKRKEPLSRMERKIEGGIGEKEILLFLPENENGEENIISFDLNNSDTAEPEFSESVFDVGIDAPTIISDSETEPEVDADSSTNEIPINKIKEFVRSGSIIEDFELLDEREVDDVSQREEIAEDDEVLDEVASTQDFTEAEINKEFLIDDENNESDYDEVTSNIESGITEDDISSAEPEDINSEIGSEDKTNNEPDEGSNPFDELENYIIEETDEDAEEIINSEPEAEEETPTKDEIEEEPTSAKKKSYTNFESHKWYKNPILYIASLSLIVAIAVVLIFWPSDEESVVEHSDSVVAVDSSADSQHSGNKKEESIAEEKVGKPDKEEAKPEQIKEKVVKVAEPLKVIEKPEKKVEETVRSKSTALYRDIKNDQTITQRIYFDGERYMVQASSWKSKSIAEREVKKLRKRGFDAFIYRVFIKSKNGTWNRVRIGYFNSRKEAEEFLKKNKI